MDLILDKLLFIIKTWQQYTYLIIFFISFAESVAFLGEIIPGAAILIIMGFIVSQGELNFSIIFIISALGAIIGDSFSYWLGSSGHFLLKNSKWRKFLYLKEGKKFFQKHGEKSVLLGRFIGPLRPIIPFIAGVFKMNYLRFLIWNILSGLGWSFAYLFLGYFLAESAQKIETWLNYFIFIIFIIIFSFIFWKIIKRRLK